MRRILQAVKNRVTRAIPVKPSYIRLDVPLASFTFDDFAKSAWTVGGRLIEGFGGRATYYVSGGLCGKTENGTPCFDQDDLAELAQKGHDIGCHTFDHIAVLEASTPVILESLQKNSDYVKIVTGRSAISSFAYPFGLASLRTKQLLANKFAVCRGVYPGINVGWVDLSQLNSICLYRTDLSFEKYVRDASRHSGWIIFSGHDVSEKPSPFGCTPKVLEDILRRVSAAGIEIATVDAAIRRIFGTEIAPTGVLASHSHPRSPSAASPPTPEGLHISNPTCKELHR